MANMITTINDEDPIHLASEIIDAALYVLQTRAFTESQQEVLTQFLADKVGLTPEEAQKQLDIELHPKYRNVLSFVERLAFEANIYNETHLIELENQTGEASKTITNRYNGNWTVSSLAEFMTVYGQSLSLSLVEVLLSLIKAENDPEKRHMQLIRVYEVSQLIGIDKWLASSFFYKKGFYSSSPEGSFSTDGDNMVLIGSGGACDLVLFDPRVEPLHAYIQNEQGRLVLQAEQSKRPVWYNDSPVKRMQLSDGDRFQIGSYALTVQGANLDVSEQTSVIALSVQDINRKIGNVSLLEKVNFTIFGGELIALIGPSGAGKTTLLNAINGVAAADTGKVLLNGRSFHELLIKDRSLVGIVPQDDLVLPELTVEESLFYSGRLRLPPEAPVEEVWNEVERVLQELDIMHIRTSRIGDAVKRGISGGQRKRVNLGQELLSRTTRILFLDEPTSGLDPRASQDIVKLVRGLADKGRIIFLVTHDLTDGIINQVDNLLALVKGGKLAFFGEKKEALKFFGVPTTDKIFQQFGDDQDKWPKKFSERVDYNLRQRAVDKFDISDHEPPSRPSKAGGLLSFWRQYSTLTTRYRKVKLRDTTGMLVIGLQPPFLALVMWIVFQDSSGALPTESMLFMLSLSCLWFGMSAAVRELISDQVIFRRERRVGVGTLPYVLSKVSVLGIIVAAQASVLSGVMYFLMGMGADEYKFSLLALLGVSTLTSWVGMGLGLFVSSLWKSSEAAVGSLPLILIPQIAFSSVMFAIRDMQWLSKFVTWFVIQRYTFDAFLKCGEKLAVRTRRGDFEASPISGTLWKLGLKSTDSASDMGLLLPELAGIMIGLTLLFLLATWLRVHRRSLD